MFHENGFNSDCIVSVVTDTKRLTHLVLLI